MTNPDADDPSAASTRGIFDGFSGYRTPTEDDWKSVLKSGMVVVDTNVLLNLYRYNSEARNSLLDTLGEFEDRLWVPNQVMVEFWRNRDNALDDPGKQLEQSVTALKADLERATVNLRSWVNRVSLDRKSASELEQVLSSALDQVISTMESVVDSSGVEMERDTSKDKVLNSLQKLLTNRVGLPFSSEELEKAISEGKRRAEKQIPPGYMDKKKEARGEGHESGDYLVWRQLMDEAKRREKDVLLVTGDIKEDWWRLRNRMTIGPRNELAEELLGEASVRLFMVRPDRLLVYARDFLSVSVSEDSVQNIELVDAQSTPEDGNGTASWNVSSLVLLMHRLRNEAPVQARCIAHAVSNGGYVSREDIYTIGSYAPDRMLKGFTRPVNRIASDVAKVFSVSKMTPDILTPVYTDMKAGFGWVDGFRVDANLHEPLKQVWEHLERSDLEDDTEEDI
jgi:hypothetical protein